jgi:TonB family protein
MQSLPRGVEILSDTQGVDFKPWLELWYRETNGVWKPLIPREVEAPVLKSGAVAILFKVLPSGRIMDGSMVLEGRSGDAALDRAAWGALTGSSYPPFPVEFRGPYLKLRAYFLYNMKVKPFAGDALSKPGDPLPGTAREQQELAPSKETEPFSYISMQPKPDKDGVYSVGPGILQPIVTQRVAAVYPADAPSDAVGGGSVLSMIIGADGSQADIQVVHSDGAAFDDAAITAIKQSRFAPGTLDGKPVPVRIFVRTRFFSDKRIAYPRIMTHYGPGGGFSQFSGRNGWPSHPVAPRSQPYDKPPVPIYTPAAEFSKEARAAKIEGIVIVSVLVTEEGETTDIRIEKSLGHGLDEKAVECVNRYRFKPAMKDGTPVAARVHVEINFKLY